MSNNAQRDDSWSLSSAFGKANKTILPILGIMGIGLYAAFFKTIKDTVESDPTATSMDGVITWYENAITSLFADAPAGLGYVLGDIFSFTADTIIPGLGTAFNLATNGAKALSAGTPDINSASSLLNDITP